MFIAELRGKVPGEVRRLEDVLTSYFFGTMKNLPTDILLIPWLEKIGAGLSKQPKSDVQFAFWECLPDGTEPDLIIRFDRQLIMVEVKYLSPLGANKDQLEREVKGGLEISRKEGRSFTFLALTNDHKEPPVLNELRSAFPPENLGYQCVWTSWQHAYDVVESACTGDNPYQATLEDLLKIMERRGLRGFRGFRNLGVRMMKCREAFELITDISSNVSSMFQELDPLLENMGFTCFPPLANTVIRDGGYRTLKEPQSWVFTYLARAYIKSLGETDPVDAIYFVKVKLDSDEPQLIVGGAIPLERQEPKPMEHSEVNGFFLNLRDHLESWEDFLEPEDPRFTFYQSLGYLTAQMDMPLSDIWERKDLNKVVELFPVLRKTLKIADRSLRLQQASGNL